MASLGSITRPCSDHTTNHKNLKTEKSIYFVMLKKLFFLLSRQDEGFSFKVSSYARAAVTGHVSLGRLYFGHKAQNKFFYFIFKSEFKSRYFKSTQSKQTEDFSLRPHESS